jgi:hypothetical protein
MQGRLEVYCALPYHVAGRAGFAAKTGNVDCFGREDLRLTRQQPLSVLLAYYHSRVYILYIAPCLSLDNDLADKTYLSALIDHAKVDP